MGPFKNDKSIKLLLEKQLQSYGISHYCYFLLPKYAQTSPIILSNYPEEWLSCYIAAELYLFDPVVVYAKQTILPFAWSDILAPGKSTASSSMDTFVSRYNIFDGFTFTLRDANNRLALLSFCNINREDNFQDNIQKNLADIQLLLIKTHDKVNKIINENQLIESEGSILSSRELEILQWVSMGKTYIESAIILGIRERTIKFHMKNIVNKLNVSNARHAIKKAIELNLLN
ncbi:LuxR family transcriptional regulator [Limnobaculum zhutongyuii]|uniref:LuxR family transcriptional regulator n=1 Tax=Limnobaculum zhutongyuii TaxID=2498113 RepID=A0A411WNC5_9GAMM|nr:LuxR family transcriptional regulator [Limnobaculum zhutongyuii]QBH97667.1 LuxR family transcriptional regulator [Limnobaculum zhutongyuii]TQS86770.1 LuxR family transcriptional regulator [Limnobaculum zhutongyuii]